VHRTGTSHRLLEQTVPVPSITVLQEGQGIGTSKRALPTPHPTFLRITHTPGQHVKFRNCHAHREPMKQAVACAAWHTLRRDVFGSAKHPNASGVPPHCVLVPVRKFVFQTQNKTKSPDPFESTCLRFAKPFMLEPSGATFLTKP